jgi:hypothetical protein
MYLSGQVVDTKLLWSDDNLRSSDADETEVEVSVEGMPIIHIYC